MNIKVLNKLTSQFEKKITLNRNAHTKVKERLYVWGYTRLGALGNKQN